METSIPVSDPNFKTPLPPSHDKCLLLLTSHLEKVNQHLAAMNENIMGILQAQNKRAALESEKAKRIRFDSSSDDESGSSSSFGEQEKRIQKMIK